MCFHFLEKDIIILNLINPKFLPQWFSRSFNKSFESWITNWWNGGQSEMFSNDIQEKSILEKFIELEELLILDKLIEDYLSLNL